MPSTEIQKDSYVTFMQISGGRGVVSACVLLRPMKSCLPRQQLLLQWGILTVNFPHRDEVFTSSVSSRLAKETAFLLASYVLVKLYQLGPCFTIYWTSQSRDIILLFFILCLNGTVTLLGSFIGI